MTDQSRTRDRVLRAVADARDELVELTRQLIRWPTVNPPGEAYEPARGGLRTLRAVARQ